VQSAACSGCALMDGMRNNENNVSREASRLASTWRKVAVSMSWLGAGIGFSIEHFITA
jgi:hypothetical protein